MENELKAGDAVLVKAELIDRYEDRARVRIAGFPGYYDIDTELIAAWNARAGAVDAGEVERLVDVLKAYEQWEADLITSNEAWEPNGMARFPRLTQELYDRMMEIQGMRNAALIEHVTGKGERNE